MAAVITDLPVSPAILKKVADLDHFRGVWAGGRVLPAGRLTRLRDAARIQSGADAITVDSQGGKLYWSRISNRTINRANLDGSDPEAIVTAAKSALASPPGGGVPDLWDGCAAERIADDVTGDGLARVAAVRRREADRANRAEG